jgi:hypothetical protein
MADQKSAKGDDGRGQPVTAEQKTTEPAPADARLVPGGSFKAARTPIGVNAMHHYTEPPAMKADLPDLSETPGWHIFPKKDRIPRG